MSYSQIKSGVKKALSNSLTLAGYSKDIIERGGNSYLALGLFCFAIEEFGKATMLSEIIESKQKEYSVPTVIFLGKNSHDLNFDKAMSNLPKEYVNFEMGSTRGASAIRDILIDFQTRMNCFYLDWDKEKNNWKSPPKVLPGLLEKSISEFESFVNKKLDIEYNSKEPTWPLQRKIPQGYGASISIYVMFSSIFVIWSLRDSSSAIIWCVFEINFEKLIPELWCMQNLWVLFSKDVVVNQTMSSFRKGDIINLMMAIERTGEGIGIEAIITKVGR